MKRKNILWLSLSFLLLSCGPQNGISSSFFSSKKESSSLISSKEESSFSSKKSESSFSSAEESTAVSSQEVSISSNSSQEEPSSSLGDSRDWERFFTLLQEAKKQQQRINDGEIQISKTGEDILTTDIYVTPSMVNALENAILESTSITKDSSEEAFLAALASLSSALEGFVTKNGTKAKEKTFLDVLQELQAGVNKNVVSYRRNTEERAILWVKGILPPKRGEGDTFRQEKYGDYIYEYAEEGQGEGWTDVNKIDQNGSERLLCYAAASANQLHWFFRVNQERISRYLSTFAPASQQQVISSFQNAYHGQQNSFIYHKVFRHLFSSLSYAYHTDIVNDYVLNGYPLPPQNNAEGFKNIDLSLTKPDEGEYAGLFYPVFGGKKLTSRMGAGDYSTFQERLLSALKEGKSVAIVHSTGTLATHIVTVWGAEVDDKGNLVAVYVTDSDNTDESYAYQALERKLVKSSSGAAKLSINIADPNHGATIMEIVTLEDGAMLWDSFFRNA